jgi:hypothetical protein
MPAASDQAETPDRTQLLREASARLVESLQLIDACPGSDHIGAKIHEALDAIDRELGSSER